MPVGLLHRQHILVYVPMPVVVGRWMVALAVARMFVMAVMRRLHNLSLFGASKGLMNVPLAPCDPLVPQDRAQIPLQGAQETLQGTVNFFRGKRPFRGLETDVKCQRLGARFQVLA